MHSFVIVCPCGWDEKKSAFEFVAFTGDTLLVEDKTIALVVGIEVSLSLAIAQVQILLIVIAMLATPDYND